MNTRSILKMREVKANNVSDKAIKLLFQQVKYPSFRLFDLTQHDSNTADAEELLFVQILPELSVLRPVADNL